MLKIGLVFAGDDGAYQVGVWKALKQEGVEKYITAVAGASCGGLNAALFLQRDDGIAEHIWSNAPQEGFTREEMGEIVDKYLNLEIFDEKSCYLAYSERRYEAVCFNLKETAIEDRKEKLLDRSAAETVPIEPLALQEKCDIIVAVHSKLPADVVNFSRFRTAQVIEIIPEDTENESDAFDAKKKMEQGFDDSLHIFMNLKRELDSTIESLLRVNSADDRKKVYQKIRQRREDEHF